MDVEIDFAAIIAKAKLPGVFDPNTVEVTNVTTVAREPHALSPHVAYGDRARVRWLVKDPSAEEIRDPVQDARRSAPCCVPRADTPLIGVGRSRCATPGRSRVPSPVPWRRGWWISTATACATSSPRITTRVSRCGRSGFPIRGVPFFAFRA